MKSTLQDQPSWWRTPAGLFFCFCWIPWVIACLVLDVIVGSKQESPALFLFDLVRYDLGLALLLGMASFGIFYAVSGASIAVQRCVLFVHQIVFIALIVLEFAAFNFMNVTGSRLDYGPIKYAWSDVGGVMHLVQESTPMGLLVFAGVLSAALLAIPLVLCREGKAAPPKSKVWYVALSTSLLALIPVFASSHRFSDVSPTLVHVAMSSSEQGEDAPIEFEQLSVDAQFSVKRRDIKKMGPPKNIVFIVLESTRAGSVNPYQSKHKVTPFLEEMAARSIWAKHSYAVMPHTSKALVAILCGFEPYLSMSIFESRPFALHSECLAGLLARHGYDTAFYQSATQRFEGRAQLVKNMGYKTFAPLESLDRRGFEKANYFGVEDAVMLEPSLKWVDKATKPLFLTYLTLTPHHNYLAPKKRYGFKEFVEDNELNQYLNTVRYVDEFAKEVVESFKQKGLYQDTIFVFVGDHGEGFAEHGRRQHDNVIYQEGISIPLIIHDPSRSKQDLIPYNINQLDIVPTVLSLAGWKINPEQWRGQDLLTLERERTLFVQCWYNNKCGARVEGQQKYIHHFGKQKDEQFSLDIDPLEKRPKKVPDASVIEQIKQWRREVNETYTEHFERFAKSYFSDKPPESMQITLQQRLNAWLSVEGVNVRTTKDVYKTQDTVKLNIYYKVLEPIPDGWRVFVHMVDAKGKALKNLDSQSISAVHDPSKWEKGQYVTETIEFTVPEKASKLGEVEVRVGLWNKKKGRADVFTGGKKTKRKWVEVFSAKVER